MKKTRIVSINKIFIIIVVFIFISIIIKLIYVGLGNVSVDGKSLAEFASNRNTKIETIRAKRGTIYASNGEILAKNVNSYTVIAYLSSSRTTNENNPQHVVDKEMTAEKLSPLINMTKERILSLLNTEVDYCDKNGENCTKGPAYQVELGPGGRGITELLKDEIDDLGLPGIDFISSTKRYYPNGNFLSYTIGYAKMNDNNQFVGEMGIESSFNDELTGIDGQIEYQADVNGYQMTTSPSRKIDAVSGKDVYLTIDTNIQMFTENAISELEEGKLEWASMSVMDAKTGKILAVASSPSFNNNTLEIESYNDPFVSYLYEPGSVMKIFSWMASMENGIYNGEETFKSGKLKVDDVTIKDWNNKGWGNISYDEGFYASSNVAASNLGLSLGRSKLKDYYLSLGFGKELDLMLPNQMNGTINFKYNSEVASSAFGQGITVTAGQMLQALSSIANDGIELKPYIVDKVVDPNNDKVVFQNEKAEIKRVASKETTDKMKELMRGVVDGSGKASTGTSYYIKGYDIIGKTGTAEIAGSSGYLKNAYVKSFGCMFPGDDPQIIIYVAASKLVNSNKMYASVKSLIQNISSYLNIYDNYSENDTITYKLDSYINEYTEKVVETLKNSGINPILIGEGNKIIKQYPNENTILNIDNNVILLTNDNNYKMIDISGLSKNEVKVFCDFANISCNYDGYGYVKEFDVDVGKEIDKELNIIFEKKYNE